MGMTNSVKEKPPLEKSRLLILSDLWGKERSDWLKYYTEPLSQKFHIQYYDCCELGGINTSDYTEEELHRQFVQGGIDKAVVQLTALEREPVHILAFSIGGTIAWKFGLITGNLQSLYAVSSTRLRYEHQKPRGYLKLFYGVNDPFVPEQGWLDRMQIPYKIFSGQEHTLYTSRDFANTIMHEINTGR